MKTASDAAAWLLERDGYLILTHRNPDGDTVGCAAALCRGLRSVGKSAWLYPNPQITDRYLTFTEELFAPEGFEPRYTVAVDVPAERMYPLGYDGRPDLAIDHHASNPGYAAETLLTPEKAACGETVFAVLRAMGVRIDPEMADALYAAISTDCGCFQYRNTTADTLRAAADLMDLGADTAALNKLLFRTSTHAKLALEGMIYSTMRQYLGGKLNVVAVSLDMLRRAEAREDDLEDLAALAGKLEGVEASLTLREMPDGKVKVSMRTNGNPDASEVCRIFGGGGHPMASGCTLDCGLAEAERRLVAAVTAAWK